MTSVEYHSISAVQNILLSLTNNLIDWLINDWLIDIDDNDDHDDDWMVIVIDHTILVWFQIKW